MWVIHSGSNGSSTVYIDRISAIRAATVADITETRLFFSIPGLSHGNPGISGLEKWAGIPGLQSLVTMIPEQSIEQLQHVDVNHKMAPYRVHDIHVPKILKLVGSTQNYCNNKKDAIFVVHSILFFLHILLPCLHLRLALCKHV